MKRLILGLGWKPVLALIVGLFSLALLIYFYAQQRGFDYNYKEVRNQFHTIDRSYHRLNYEILRNALFAYSNLDLITGELESLHKEYSKLHACAYLQRPAYQGTKAHLDDLENQIERYEAFIDDFMMLNAGIKNSFVYITSLSARKVELFKDRPQAYGLLLSLIAQVSQARMLSDADFLQNLEARALPLARLKGLNSEQTGLIRSLLIHIHFISENYPAFVQTVNHIEASGLDKTFEAAESLFLEEAKSDFAMLDRFVFILLVLFLTALALIIGLLIRTGYENRRLLDLKEQLRHDQLTGLKSRSKFELMEKEFEHPTLLLLNIDHFKHINDFYGSMAGNAVLREIALLIRQPVLETYRPHFFRLGGDDFGIVLQNVPMDRAQQLAQMLKQSIESYAFVYEEIELYVTVSIAINCSKPLLENADLVLKYEKRYPKEGIVLFSEAFHLKEEALRNISITHEIKKALDRDAIVPWFQPIVNLNNGTIMKYEALVRLIDEAGEVMGPAHFLPIAHKTRYYSKITSTMLEKVFHAMDGYHARFSINLAMRDLMDESLVEMLLGLLETNTEKASRLDFELLESEELDDLEVVKSFISRVKDFGCHISIDDFGSGFSNFAYILELNVDQLKIDGSLISHIGFDKKSRKSVETIVQFAKQLELEAVAEFVEDEETAELLRSMGVEYAQGYLYGRPAPTINNDITMDR